MTPHRKGRWSNPATIFFATELPANDRTFKFALMQASRANARLIIFHAYERTPAPPVETYGLRHFNYAAAAESELQYLEILKHQACAAGIECETMVREGAPSQLIVECAHQQGAERIVVGSNSPGPISRVLLGSVAEEVLRSSDVPVCVIGPEVVDQSHSGRRYGRVLCATSLDGDCTASATLAAEIARQNETELLMLHVLKLHESAGMLARRGLEEIERDLVSLVPEELRRKVTIEPIIVPGDPVEEILFQANTGRVELLVFGAPETSPLSTLTRHGVVYRVLLHAPCPVLALSPGALLRAGSRSNPRQAGIGISGTAMANG